MPWVPHALHLGGVANVDEIAFPTKGWSGMTVRVFNLEKRQWSISWINSKLGPNKALWEQAFSPDGRAWETNWVMDLTRGS